VSVLKAKTLNSVRKVKVLTAEKARPTSGGSRGRRLGQLPRAPREGAPKRGEQNLKVNFSKCFKHLLRFTSLSCLSKCNLFII